MRLQLVYLRLNLAVILAAAFMVGALCKPAIGYAQNSKALPAIISLLLDSDRCITPIKVGDVVFDTLDPTCPSEGRGAGTFAAYYSFSHAGGPLHIDLLSNFPNSYDAYLFLRNGEARDGSLVVGDDDGSDDDGHEDLLSSRIIESNLPAGRYTIEATAVYTGVVGSLSLSVYGNKVTAKATGKLNDTGIKFSGNETSGNNNSADSAVDQCIASTQGGNNQVAAQDCSFGRDADAIVGDGYSRFIPGFNSDYNDGDGETGFSFLKVSASGAPLPASAVAWSCVKDNVTGLMWEVKTDDNGLHDKDHTYTWFDTNASTNGGANGTEDGGTCFASVSCDTAGFVLAVNTAGLCGYSDWRLPTVIELRGIVNNNISSPAIDTAFFPNASSLHATYTASPNSAITFSPWFVFFGTGRAAFFGSRGNFGSVRLVRGGQ